jgi:hypothetical protein
MFFANANSFARMKQHKKTDAHVGIPLFEMVANLSQLKKVLSKTTYVFSFFNYRIKSEATVKYVFKVHIF